MLVWVSLDRTLSPAELEHQLNNAFFGIRWWRQKWNEGPHLSQVVWGISGVNCVNIKTFNPSFAIFLTSLSLLWMDYPHLWQKNSSSETFGHIINWNWQIYITVSCRLRTGLNKLRMVHFLVVFDDILLPSMTGLFLSSLMWLFVNGSAIW